MLPLNMADWPLKLRDKLVIGVIFTKSNKFASGVRTKATFDLKLDKIPSSGMKSIGELNKKSLSFFFAKNMSAVVYYH